MTDNVRPPIVIVQGAGGPKAVIAGHRIRVMDVAIWHEQMEMSPEEIIQDYPSLTLDEVHVALEYYRDHREEIDRKIDDDHADVARLRQIIGEGPLAAKLRAARSG